MAKNKLKFKTLSVMLATSLVVGSFQGIPVKAEKGEGTVTAVNRFDSGYDSQNAYNGDLGCIYSKDSTTFKVWSPLATEVVLCRYATGSDGESGAKDLGTVKMTKGEKGVWSCTVDGDIVNTYYTYKVTANGKTNEAVDIYAKAVGVNGDRAMVVDLDSTDPENWDKSYKRDKMKISDISVWEIHVRDFSIDASSGVSEAHRGKFKAFTETGTTINGQGKISTCVDYLKDLGVTHVQILPMYDYASVDETKVTTSLGNNYNWGYDPENYNAPEGSYSTNPYDGNVRIKELKEMVQALHDAGIKVIMDVVYNHTYDTVDSNFNKIMPDYYYKINNDMTYNNQSGCGNATRSEGAMYNKFMRDSLLYWAEEYNLDGFRFDLMGIHDVNTMNQIREDMDKKFGEDTIILYGEGWTGDGKYDFNSAHKAHEAQLAPDIGYFNDQIRDAIKGEHKFDGTIGLVQTNYASGTYLEPGQKWPNNVFGGIMGSVGKTDSEWGMWRPFWSKSSNSVLAYCSAHDNLTLWDKLAEADGKNFSSTSDKMKRMNKMAGAVTLVSHGGYFMQAGEEFARTKNGDDNSYKSPDSANKIDWTRVETYSDIKDYYKGMLQIRNVFSGFKTEWTRSGDNWNPIGCNLKWVNKDETGVTAFTLTNNVSGEWNKLAVIINNSTSEQTVNLSDASKWVVIADGNKAGLTKISECGSSVKAAGKSVVVAVPKDTFDANPNVADKLNRDTNKAPVISATEDLSVAIGADVAFTVTATDADKDAVTLSAKDVPEGAEFDAKTGKFTWKGAKEGTYTITFTANDGKATATAKVVITVTSPASALKELMAEVEGKKYSKADFTEETWNALEEALAKARTVMGEVSPSEDACAQAKDALQKAYTQAKEELAARSELETYVEEAAAKINKADANADADLLADAKTVLTETQELLKGVAGAKAYEAAKSNLEDSVAAIAVSSGKPCIRVKSSWPENYVYVWSGTGTSEVKHTGEWPGKKMTEKDADGNFYFELEKDMEYKVIINAGAASKMQTRDLIGLSGDITITVGEMSEKDENGTSFYAANSECKPVQAVTGSVSTDSLKNAIEIAKTYKEEDYEAGGFALLQEEIAKAEDVLKDSKATQLQVNQTARSLRAAWVALKGVNEGPVATATPVVPTKNPEQTKKPEETTAPTETVKPDETTAPTETVKPGETTAPTETTKPDETTAPTKTEKPGETAVPTETEKPVTSDVPAKTEDPKVTSAPTTKPAVTDVPPTKAPVTPTQTPAEDVFSLKISSLKFSPSLYQVVNKKIKLSVEAENVEGTCLYKYAVYDEKGTEVASSDYKQAHTYTYTAKKEGNYKFKVWVKDESGKEVEKSKSIIVVAKKLTVVKMKASKNTIKKGKTLQFTATATGGKKAYKYKFTVINSKGKTVKASAYISKKTWKWKTTQTGTYKIKVTVKDSLGVKATKTIKKIRVTK